MSIVLTVGFIFLTASVSFATLYESGPLVFETQDQSMWGSDDGFTLNEDLFLGTPWNTDPITIGGIAGSVTTETILNPAWVGWAAVNGPYLASCETFFGCQDWLKVGEEPSKYVDVTIDTRTGAEAKASTWGKAGFNLGVGFDGGSVDAIASYNASLDIPDLLNVGELFSLNPDNDFVGENSLSTSLGEVSAGVEAVFGAKANLGGKACFIGFGCAGGNTTIGFDPKELDLVSLEDGEIKILGEFDPGLFQFGSPIEIPPNTPGLNFGNVTVHLPEINASGGLNGDRLAATGEADFLDLRVDLDGVVLNSFGLPSVLGNSVNFGPVSVGYDLVDVELGPTIDLEQDFWLDLMLMVDLSFSSPVFVDGFGEVTSLTTRWDSLPDFALLGYDAVTVTPEFYLDAWLNNTTRLGVDGVFTVDALTAEFSIEAFGFSVDVGEIGFGRIYEERGNLFNSPALFDERFRLGGFNRVAGENFTLQAGTEPIPEPGTLLLLGAGLIGLVGLRQKLKK